MKTLYFVRHGESQANAAGITAGGGLDVELTRHGIDQAIKTAQTLKDKGVQLIVSSPQKRAYHTAYIIAKEIGYPPEKILTNPLFVERQLGDMTGKPHDEVQLYFDIGAAPPGGESTQALRDRIVSGLAWLKSLPADKIVLVSHGGPGRVIRSIYRNEQHNSINSLGRMGTAEVLELSL
jgi:broad specificity phosphatase PhoE